MTPRDLSARTLSELRELLQRREISAREILEALHARMQEMEPSIGAFLFFDFEAALVATENADLQLPLGGIPIALKDNIQVAGQPCTCASRMLENYRASYDATVAQKLRAAGAILFGRTNLDEFAMGSSTENSAVRTTMNPWDRTRVAGGSSGGSAASVAADEAVAALGSDTGGSVRQPASLCGVVGLKPSYGRVSRFGLTAFASSLDQIGCLTKDVRDAALLLQAIAGEDERDSTSLRAPVANYAENLGREIRGMKIGVAREHAVAGIDPEVSSLIEKAIAHYQSLGAEIVEISLPHTDYAVAVYYVLATAEASANLARFDGVRYGHRADAAKNLLEHYERTRAEGFGPEVKRRIILGTYVLSAGYYDAYYLRAQKIRQLIRTDFARAFEKVDAILSPTSPIPAFQPGERDALQMYLADIFTIPANLAGLCGISVPCGFARAESNAPLPVGLQLLGKAFDETTILQLAHAYEQTTNWHKCEPGLRAGAMKAE